MQQPAKVSIGLEEDRRREYLGQELRIHQTDRRDLRQVLPVVAA